jgi:pimeloyl-ACP methyl ester carboxylesterase
MLPLSAGLSPWKDPSPHTIRFVTVEKGVRLEVVDWGDSGRHLVLLAGGGDTAHVFDDFAPSLRPAFTSTASLAAASASPVFSPEGYGADRLGDDVLAVLDALKPEKPILVGHSLGGEELSSVAKRYPNWVSALVYLEAGYPYAFDNGKGPTMKEIEDASTLLRANRVFWSFHSSDARAWLMKIVRSRLAAGKNRILRRLGRRPCRPGTTPPGNAFGRVAYL